jgi:hypothetical protein
VGKLPRAGAVVDRETVGWVSDGVVAAGRR